MFMSTSFSYYIWILVSDSVLVHSSKYEFEIDTVNYIGDGTTISQNSLAKHPLSKLDYGDYLQLCREAMQYVWKEGIPVRVHSNTHPFLKTKLNDFYVHRGKEATGEYLIGMRCPLSPTVIVSLADEKSKDTCNIRIIVRENKFLADQEYNFFDEIAERITAVILDPSNLFHRVLSHFFLFDDEMLWEMCVAAISRIRDKIGLDVTFGQDLFGTVRLYDIVYEHREVNNIQAVECNSSPKMLIRRPYVRTQSYRTTFVVVLERDNVKEEILANHNGNLSSDAFVSVECDTSDCDQNDST